MIGGVGPLMALKCKHKRITSALAGGVMAYTGTDTLLVGMGVPRMAHYALAGVAVDASG